MKHWTKLYSYLCVAFAALSLQACVYDNLEGCPQGVVLHVTALSHTEECGDLEHNTDNLKKVQVAMYTDAATPVLKGVYEAPVKDDGTIYVPVTLTEIGKYKFAVWATEPENPYFVAAAPWNLKNDKVKTAEGLAELFYGVSETYDYTDRSNMGTVIDTVNVNVLPYKQNLRVELEKATNGDVYSVSIEDRNPIYSFEYGLYERVPAVTRQLPAVANGTTAGVFELLKKKFTPDYYVSVSLGDKQLYTKSLNDLFKEAAAVAAQRGETFNPDCNNTITIKLEVAQYMVVRVIVQDYMLVTTETEI